jgi:serine-threonine kinase receptor-associated protein
VWLDDDTVVAAGSDGGIRFWNVNSQPGEKPTRILTVDAEIRDMELSADKRMLTVAAGTKVSFFDLTKMALVKSHKMPIHFREVSQIVVKYIRSVLCTLYKATCVSWAKTMPSSA